MGRAEPSRRLVLPAARESLGTPPRRAPVLRPASPRSERVRPAPAGGPRGPRPFPDPGVSVADGFGHADPRHRRAGSLSRDGVSDPFQRGTPDPGGPRPVPEARGVRGAPLLLALPLALADPGAFAVPVGGTPA